VLAVLGLVAALSGLWMAHFYAWPEGDGEVLYMTRLVFGSAMIASILLALDAVRRRDFVTHGAWMMRGYAIGLGAGTQVLTHLPWFVIVGAGPAGVRCAEALADAGLKPIVFDEAERPGGQIYRQPPTAAGRPTRSLYGFERRKAEALHRVLPAYRDRIDHRPSTLVWNVFDRRLDLLTPDGPREQRFDHLLLATGAMDRTLPFPGWTLPGVFTLGGAQVALKAQGVSIGRRVAFVGAGPLLPLVTHQYAKAGANVVAALDVTPLSAKLAHLPGLLRSAGTLAKGVWYTGRNGVRGLDVRYGVGAVRVEGERCVAALA
jgi:hypothetical protein